MAELLGAAAGAAAASVAAPTIKVLGDRMRQTLAAGASLTSKALTSYIMRRKVKETLEYGKTIARDAGLASKVIGTDDWSAEEVETIRELRLKGELHETDYSGLCYQPLHEQVNALEKEGRTGLLAYSLDSDSSETGVLVAEAAFADQFNSSAGVFLYEHESTGTVDDAVTEVRLVAAGVTSQGRKFIVTAKGPELHDGLRLVGEHGEVMRIAISRDAARDSWTRNEVASYSWTRNDVALRTSSESEVQGAHRGTLREYIGTEGMPSVRICEPITIVMGGRSVKGPRGILAEVANAFLRLSEHSPFILKELRGIAAASRKLCGLLRGSEVLETIEKKALEKHAGSLQLEVWVANDIELVKKADLGNCLTLTQRVVTCTANRLGKRVVERREQKLEKMYAVYTWARTGGFSFVTGYVKKYKNVCRISCSEVGVMMYTPWDSTLRIGLYGWRPGRELPSVLMPWGELDLGWAGLFTLTRIYPEVMSREFEEQLYGQVTRGLSHFLNPAGGPVASLICERFGGLDSLNRIYAKIRLSTHVLTVDRFLWIRWFVDVLVRGGAVISEHAGCYLHVTYGPSEATTDIGEKATALSIKSGIPLGGMLVHRTVGGQVRLADAQKDKQAVLCRQDGIPLRWDEEIPDETHLVKAEASAELTGRTRTIEQRVFAAASA